MENLFPFESSVLPDGIRSTFVNANGLRVHVLEAGHEVAGRPCVILLHGFPEIAYTWRHNMLALAAAGFHVIAPDQRGYGRTTGSNNRYECDLHEFGVLNLVSDVLAILAAFGHKSARAIVGHDYGAPVAAHAAMLRPDVFQSLVLMAAPFPGPPAILLDTEDPDPGTDPVLHDLKQLNPPRKHYQWYYASRDANEEMSAPSQGLRDFMRAYFHYKSGDYGLNKPVRMQEWSAQELAKLPTYYIMERDKGMSASVAGFMPTPDQIRSCKWLTEEELGVYVAEYARTGFQGGLNWYRCDSHGLNRRQTRILAGKTIDVPSLFIAGDRDWAVYQKPGFLEAMQNRVCTNLRGSHFIQGAGHWVQQENPDETNKALLDFLG